MCTNLTRRRFFPCLAAIFGSLTCVGLASADTLWDNMQRAQYSAANVRASAMASVGRWPARRSQFYTQLRTANQFQRQRVVESYGEFLTSMGSQLNSAVYAHDRAIAACRTYLRNRGANADVSALIRMLQSERDEMAARNAEARDEHLAVLRRFGS